MWTISCQNIDKNILKNWIKKYSTLSKEQWKYNKEVIIKSAKKSSSKLINLNCWHFVADYVLSMIAEAGTMISY